MLTYQLLPKLQVGAELFHQTAGTPATTSVGVGVRYDVNDTYHLLGYVRRGIQTASETDRYRASSAVGDLADVQWLLACLTSMGEIFQSVVCLSLRKFRDD